MLWKMSRKIETYIKFAYERDYDLKMLLGIFMFSSFLYAGLVNFMVRFTTLLYINALVTNMLCFLLLP